MQGEKQPTEWMNVLGNGKVEQQQQPNYMREKKEMRKVINCNLCS